ncbi:DUF3703 domain-containing protein [Ilumatobacter nonamiensis]|uniref:DUF3703 domain-containing protein n=1 Tax=Ilumatobacter nonamiensis TaxID=467093 RepID=UPI0003476F3D|nr:DUF3703 domain-containing protein [Ilumatobacter nonamiensis]
MNADSARRRAAYRTERDRARRAFAEDDGSAGWRHLERAHVLAQPDAIPHIGSHIAMLRRALIERDPGEAAGQVLRALLAGPASVTGRIPTGNDGRARTPLSERMPIPDDLAPVLPNLPAGQSESSRKRQNG